jgi:acetylglutamate kinase
MTRNWLEDLRDDTVVVKFGGNAMVDDALAAAFCEDILTLQSAGIRVVVSHGGGPQISAELAANGIHSEFRGGLRVTTADAVHVVREVLLRIGAELVDQVHAVGGAATAIAGDTQNLFVARRAGTVVEGVVVDLGHVGEVESVDTTAVTAALNAGSIPVVSAIARDVESGELLNINADAAAAALAAALGAKWLLLLTDVTGLYRDWPNRATLVSVIDENELATLEPTLEAGMIPKVAAARSAIQRGVRRVAIMDGRVPHLLVSEPFGDSGTIVTTGERTAP